jgi:HEAT repeat protein
MPDSPVTILELEKALAPIAREVNDARRDVADMQRAISEVKSRADKSYLYLFGNGEPGLDERVRNIERAISDARGAVRWLIVVIGGYVVVKAVEIILSHF